MIAQRGRRGQKITACDSCWKRKVREMLGQSRDIGLTLFLPPADQVRWGQTQVLLVQSLSCFLYSQQGDKVLESNDA
jgi:hypothetical protein